MLKEYNYDKPQLWCHLWHEYCSKFLSYPKYGHIGKQTNIAHITD